MGCLGFIYMHGNPVASSNHLGLSCTWAVLSVLSEATNPLQPLVCMWGWGWGAIWDACSSLGEK